MRGEEHALTAEQRGPSRTRTRRGPDLGAGEGDGLGRGPQNSLPEGGAAALTPTRALEAGAPRTRTPAVPPTEASGTRCPRSTVALPRPCQQAATASPQGRGQVQVFPAYGGHTRGNADLTDQVTAARALQSPPTTSCLCVCVSART